MTRILKARVENILGAREVEFAPQGESLTIGGKNGQGKSSALWALVMALGGKKQIPDMPVHAGAEKGTTVIELDRFTVHWEVSADRETKLRIESRDGTRYPSPQAMLNDIFGGLSFDPGAFMNFDGPKREKTLLSVVGLDFTENAAKQKAANDERLAINREVKSLEVRLAAAPHFPDAPAAEVDVAESLAKLKQYQEVNAAIAEANNEALRCDREVLDIDKDIEYRKQTIASLSQQREEIDEQIAELEGRNVRSAEARAASVSKATEIRNSIVDSLAANDPRQAVVKLTAEIGEADTINRKVRANAARTALEQELAAKKTEAEKVTGIVEILQKERAEALAKAPFPVPGLAFTDGDITLDGIPFEQLNESRRWEISTAIGFALNPQGIMFMRTSGGLDSDSRERIRQRAKACGVQLFLEVVDDADDVQILIEDGTVKEDRICAPISEAAVHA